MWSRRAGTQTNSDVQANLSIRPLRAASHRIARLARYPPPAKGLEVYGERLTFDLKHNVSRVVGNLDNFIFIFKDVSRQKDFSRIDPKETRIMSAAHAEAVPINSGRPCSIFTGFFVAELCADRAKTIDIELFQVRSNISRRATRRENGQQGACCSVGWLFKEYPASTVIDRCKMRPSGARACGQHAMQISLILMKQH